MNNRELADKLEQLASVHQIGVLVEEHRDAILTALRAAPEGCDEASLAHVIRIAKWAAEKGRAMGKARADCIVTDTETMSLADHVEVVVRMNWPRIPHPPEPSP